ncbi:hypothetical protein [Methanogenium cariaci]|jgi:mannose-1-phosphate guanylyltransferase / mannose-6-phosphate isomerase
MNTYNAKKIRGFIPLDVIDVQNGEYVGEDDIVRFDDDFEWE